MAPRKSKKVMLVGAGFFDAIGKAVKGAVKGVVKGVKGVNNIAKQTGVVGTIAGLSGNPGAYTAARSLGYGKGRVKKPSARRH